MNGEKKLNGEASILYQKLKVELDGIRKLNQAQWENHDKRAKDLGDYITKNNGTDWKVLGIFVVLVGSLVTLLGAAIKTNSNSIDKMDFSLQREMRDVSGIRKAEIEGLDTALQREMSLMNDVQNTFVSNMKTEVNRLISWQEKHDISYPPKWLIKKVDMNEEKLLELIKLEERVNSLYRVLDEVKEMTTVKSHDRFTGAEGRLVQQHLDKLEDRLTFLTKELLRDGG